MNKMIDEREYQMCKRCIMDTSDPEIVFDADGICNHCKEYEKKLKIINATDSNVAHQYALNMLEKIKKDGRGKKYDCVIAYSGGADSTFVVDWAKKAGLRAILVTVDDGWGLEETARNIKRVSEKTGFPLEIFYIDHDEINDLYRSFILANVIDIEMPIDQALQAVFVKTAKKYKVKYILTGSNIQTEGIMAKSWAFNKQDLKNILDIHKHFGKVELKQYPMISLWTLYWYRLTKSIQYFKPLWYMEYDRAEAVEYFQKEYGWEPYEKNSESIFTRFDKRVILPCKFGVDKKRGNYSAMIMSGQLTRSQAKKMIEYGNDYHPAELWIEDLKVVCDRLEFDREWFVSKYLFAKRVPHTNYATYAWLYKIIGFLKKVRNFIK
jgi:N-acetyl sugar amidotransferase